MSNSDAGYRGILARFVVLTLFATAYGSDDGGEVRDLDASGTVSGSGSGSASGSVSGSGSGSASGP